MSECRMFSMVASYISGILNYLVQRALGLSYSRTWMMSTFFNHCSLVMVYPNVSITFLRYGLLLKLWVCLLSKSSNRFIHSSFVTN
jgi:hypothetical protein